jgi:predicted Zn-dependent protease
VPGKPDEERALLLGAARNAVRLRNWDAALARFDEFFRRYGEDVELRREYAGVLIQAGRLRPALAEYQKLLTRAPEDAGVRSAYADLAVRLRDYRQASELLTPALQREPGNVELATRLARAYVFQDDIPRALRIYDQHLAQLRPEGEKVPSAFPALLTDLDRPAEALAFLKPLLTKQPRNAELQATRVRAWARLGDRPRALEALQALADLGPESVRVRLDLGDTLYAS